MRLRGGRRRRIAGAEILSLSGVKCTVVIKLAWIDDSAKYNHSGAFVRRDYLVTF